MVKFYQSVACIVVAGGAIAVGEAQTLEPEHVKAAQEYWSQPNRYESAQTKEWAPRLTPEGSLWLWRVTRNRAPEKSDPTFLPESVEGNTKDWDAWINKRIAYDFFIAEADSRAANGKSPTDKDTVVVPGPGPAPASLIAKFGEPPSFAEAVRPLRHRTTFHCGTVFESEDNVKLPNKNIYYRNRAGVRHFGSPFKNLPQIEIGKIMSSAGLNESERKVFAAVSMLEGGFESVNTYDTGFVSVGFIQFACLTEGKGSLGQVLLQHAKDNREDFRANFQAFGVGVHPDGRLMAADLETGKIELGANAAQLIIKDKRLIAAFYRAGRSSFDNRVAQVKIAKQQYFPRFDNVVFPFNGQLVVTKVDTFIKSEAGLATLMDRKVNTGKLGQIATVVEDIMKREKLSRPEELLSFEAEIIQRMRFRKDYLVDPTLSKPAPRQ